MGLARLLASRSLGKRPGRTLFSILGVAVGIATVVCVFTLDHNTIEGRKHKNLRTSEDDWTADLEVRPRHGLEDPRGALEGLPGVDGVAAMFQQDVGVRPDDPARAPAKVRLLGLEARSAPQLGAYSLREGRHLDASAEGWEVLVGAGLVEGFGLALGDRVWLSKARRGVRELCKDGEKQAVDEREPEVEEVPFEVVGILDEESVGRRARGMVVVVDYDRGRELLNQARLDPRFWVKRDPTVNLESLQQSLGTAWSYDLNRNVIIGAAADERAFRNGVRIAGLLAMLLGLYVIFHTLSMSLVERVREVGVLHALGTTRGQVARVFFVEACVVAFGAGLLGLFGGLGLARFLLRRGFTTVGRTRINFFEVPWEVVSPLAAVGVGIALLGSVYPLLRARGTDVVSALRGDQGLSSSSLSRSFRAFSALLLLGVLPLLYLALVPVVGESQRELVLLILAGLLVLWLLLGLPLLVPGLLAFACSKLAQGFERRWPLAGLLASRTIQVSPARVSGSVAAIALVTAAFVGLKGMTQSLRAEVQVWGEEAVADKVLVRNLPDVPLEDLRRTLEPLEEVRALETTSAYTFAPFKILGLEDEELARFGPCEDPALLEAVRTGRGMIVTPRLANDLALEVGSVHHVNTQGHGVVEFPVVAISEAYGYSPWPDERMYAVVAASEMKRYFCLDALTLDEVAIVLAPGADPGGVRALLDTAYGPIEEGNWWTGAEVVQWQVDDIDRDFVLFDVILGLTALLAGLGVLNGQLLGALERSKELGVLKAMGVTRGQLTGTVLLESLVVGGLGGGLGVLLGAGLTPVIVELLSAVSNLELPYQSAGPWFAICLAGAVGVTLMAGLYPIWRMNRTPAVAAVRAG